MITDNCDGHDDYYLCIIKIPSIVVLINAFITIIIAFYILCLITINNVFTTIITTFITTNTVAIREKISHFPSALNV